MDAEALVGRLLVVGLPGPLLTSEVATHLRSLQAGGLIAFERNYHSPSQFRKLLDDVANALGYCPLVMVDHEGGRVTRFRTGVTQFPDALSIGASQQAAQLYQQGTIEAHELRALGVHVNLAPCVDVLVGGSDPVIGTRSYGSDPHQVATFATQRIRGLQAHGVAACAKHFPGLGAVPKDPHRELPTVTLDWPSMREIHLRPFTAAIGAGVATIMSSHVCYPELEATDVPATFSARLIRQLLREELGFDGVALTDDMEMGALRRLGSLGEAMVKAVDVGHDMVLVCSHVEAQRQAAQALAQAVGEGRLPEARLAEAIGRVDRLRQRFRVP